MKPARSIIWFAALAVLAGCAAGTRAPQAMNENYTVPRNFQTTYMRAQHQTLECLTNRSRYEVYATVDSAMQRATVLVRDAATGDEVARTEVQSLDARHTQVTHTAVGGDRWGAAAVDAMRRSIMSDTTVCATYR